MTTLTDLDKIVSIKEDLHDAIEEKGVDVPSTTIFEEYPNKVREIQTGNTFDVDDATIEKYIETATQLVKIRVKDGGLSESKLDTNLITIINNKAEKSELPTKLSQLTNDSGYVTETIVYNKTEVDTKLNLKADKSLLDSYYNKTETDTKLDLKADRTDLLVYAKKTELPTKTSQLENDSGYITQASIDAKADKLYVDNINTSLTNRINEVEAEIPDISQLATKTELAKKANKANTLEGYGIYDAYTKEEINLSLNTKANKTDIPTKTSQLTNDSGYITESAITSKADKVYVDTQLNLKANITDVPSKTSQLENDTDYITSDDITGKADILYVDTELNKKADKSSVPTKTSQLINDSGFLTQASIDDKADKVYVDNQLLLKADKTELNNYATLTKVNEIDNRVVINTNDISTIKTDITDLSTLVSKKANADDVYTKIVIDDKLSNKADKSDIPVVPTKVSAFINDAGYITNENIYLKDEVDTLLDKKADKTDLNNYATKTELANKADLSYVNTQLSLKADKTDLDNKADKTELVNYAKKTDLNAYATKDELNGYATKTDLDNYNTKAEITNLLSTKADKSDLSNYATKTEVSVKADKADTLYGYGITDAYTKSQIDEKIAGALHYKGSVETYEDLPTTGQKTGDVYNVINEHKTDPKFPAGTNVAWNGDDWDILGGTVDLSAYAKLDYVNSQLLLKADKTDLDNYNTKQEIESLLNGKADKSQLDNYATKTDLNNYNTKTEISNLLLLKADKTDLDNYNTKQEVADLLVLKADKTQLANYYTKNESDLLLNDKADKTELNNYALKDSVYTKTEVDTFINGRKSSIINVVDYGFNSNLRQNQIVDGNRLVNEVIRNYETERRFVVVQAGDFKYTVLGIVNADGVLGFTAEGQIIDPTKLSEELPLKEQVLFLYVENSNKTYSIYTKDKKVSITGDYNDLINKPVNVSEFNNDAEYVTKSEVGQTYYTKEYIDANYYTKTSVDSLLLQMNNRITELEAKVDALQVDGELTDTKVKLILS